ncbi:hypothetical protein Hanom_Chr04g00326741 [Helianthus anomalus]
MNEADNFNNVIIEEGSDISEEDTPFHYFGVDDDFPTLTELFQSHNEDEVRRKVVERITTKGVPETVPQEDLLEERKRWFKVMPKERKFKRSFQYFTDHPDKSLGDILSWGYLEDLKVYAIRREFGVQYFEFLSDFKTLPWWDIEELVQTKNIKQYYYGLEVKIHDQRLWNYIKLQAKDNFPDWKPHKPKQNVKIDPVTGEKDITLKIKLPRCLRICPEARITLFDAKTGNCRCIHILDPMWLVNCSKKDIDYLFFKKIVYNEPDKVQAQQFQKIVNVCFVKDINSGRYWESKFRDLELEEFLKSERRSERFKKIAKRAAQIGRRKFARPPETDQTPIKSQENKIPRWSKARDGDPEYRKWWNETRTPLRRQMLEERKEKRKQKARENRRNSKAR